MIGYVVPHQLFPAGYHCNPELPLPFMNLAAQKSHYGFYHMGIYAMPELESWFRVRYAEAVPTKLDMGKSCIRFKNPKHIPYNLIGELVSKVSVYGLPRYCKSKHAVLTKMVCVRISGFSLKYFHFEPR